MFEKEQLTEQLANTDPNNTEWAEIAKDSFDFGLQAYRRFKKGKSEPKRVIFKTIGSEPILLDRNLHFQLRMPFIHYKKMVKTIKEEKSSLILKNSLSNQSNLDFSQKSSLWCTIWDDVRTYLTSTIDPKEKTRLLNAFAHFKTKEGGKLE